MAIFIRHICGEQKNTLGHRCFRQSFSDFEEIVKKYILKNVPIKIEIKNSLLYLFEYNNCTPNVKSRLNFFKFFSELSGGGQPVWLHP